MSSPTKDSPLAMSPRCLASTGDSFTKNPVRVTQPRITSPKGQHRPNLFRQAQLSPDGTTLITHNEDQCLRTFVLPVDLLEEHDAPQNLQSHSLFQSATAIQSYALYPGFSLEDASTTLVLCGSANIPITLRNAFDYGYLHGQYRFQNPMTEAHCAPRSLTFTRDGSHFLAGSDNVLAIFDSARGSYGPLTTHQLRPGKREAQVDPWHLTRRGNVSALNISSEGILALGTTSSEIGVYDDEGLGDCISVFTLDPDTGTGVMDLKWSPDGCYLFVAQRQSDLIDVYDIRKTQQKLMSLSGRAGKTAQRLSIDVLPTANGCEVWGGGTDGCVRMWSNPGRTEEKQPPNAELKLHEATVSSAVWHSSGSVLATCSGDRSISATKQCSSDSSDGIGDSCKSKKGEASLADNSLKLWSP